MKTDVQEYAQWLQGTNGLAFEHARRVTGHHARTFALATRLLPKKKRWATYALYGFCRYADNLVDVPRDRTVKERVEELERLRTELETAFRHGESEHPAVGPLVAVFRAYGIPENYAFELIEGVRMDLVGTRYDTFEELYTFAYRVAGVVGLMMTYVLGFRGQAALCHAEALGIAMQLTNILRDIQEDLEQDRLYLPREELRRFGVSLEQLRQGRMTNAMRDFMHYQVQRADHYYEMGNEGIGYLEGESRIAIRAASDIYRAILRQLEQRDLNPFLGRAVVPTGRKLTLLARSVVRALSATRPETGVALSSQPTLVNE